jgi:Tol biopolymer transport system component
MKRTLRAAALVLAALSPLAGFTEPGFVHLFVVPADGGTPRQLTRGDWNVGFRFDMLSANVGWSFTPDGRTIVVEGLNAPDADLRYRDAELYAVDVATGAIRTLTPARGTWRQPVVSHDGRWIAYTSSAPCDRRRFLVRLGTRLRENAS